MLRELFFFKWMTGQKKKYHNITGKTCVYTIIKTHWWMKLFHFFSSFFFFYPKKPRRKKRGKNKKGKNNGQDNHFWLETIPSRVFCSHVWWWCWSTSLTESCTNFLHRHPSQTSPPCLWTGQTFCCWRWQHTLSPCGSCCSIRLWTPTLSL